MAAAQYGFVACARGQTPDQCRNLCFGDHDQRFQRRHSIRFILAGERPQVLGEPVHDVRKAMELAQTWRCHAPAARLDQAMSLGAELGGELALILVLTDQPPPRGIVPEKGRLQWWSFGTKRTNLAIVNAARTNREGADRCLIEVANLSEEPERTTLAWMTPGEARTALTRACHRWAVGEWLNHAAQ